MRPFTPMQHKGIEHGTISIHFVQEALAAVQGRGVPSTLMLQRAGIPPRFLDEPLARISPQQFGALWRELARWMGDEFFALDSHAARPGAYVMLCHAVLDCSTLHHALKRICRYTGLLLDDMRATLAVRDDTATLHLHDARVRQSPFAHATYFMVVYGLACWLIARRIPLLACAMAGTAPASYEAEYRLMFCETLRFAATEGQLVFPSKVLDCPVAQTRTSLVTFLKQAPDVFLVKYRNTHSLAGKIRMRLRSLAPADWPDLDAMAHDLGLAQATLRRHLTAEGVRFQSIKNDLRRDMAITALRKGTHSIEAVAHHLGFTEAAAFHRAFRKWTGMRPSDYR